MTARAAVLREVGKPLRIEEIVLAEPRADQARVRIVASGVCHSDLSIKDGRLPHPTPVVLGHEGAGVVMEVGADVTHVRPGDHVMITWNPACGHCWFCLHGEPHLCDQAITDLYGMPYATDTSGAPLMAALGTSTFATETLSLARALIPLDPEIPLEIAALIGCAVTTGAGAALNTAPVRAGSSVLVIGLGGVGLSTMLGARVQDPALLIVSDPSAEKRELALSLGATHALDPADGPLPRQVRRLTDRRGADHVFEVVGRSSTIRDAYDCARRGGSVCVVGAGKFDDLVSFNAFELFNDAKTIVGCQYGSSDPYVDFPRFLAMHTDGQLDLSRLITRRIALEEVNEAFADLEAGVGIRSVIVND